MKLCARKKQIVRKSILVFAIMAVLLLTAWSGVFGSNADEHVYQEGEAVTYTVKQKVGTFYKDTMNTYPGLVLEDRIPEGLAYISASVADGTGKDITGSGTLKYDEESRLLSFTMGTAWLASESNYNGQTLTMTICAKALLPEQETVVIDNTACSRIGSLSYRSNPVSLSVVRPVLAITKEADKEIYNSDEHVQYTITTNQTVKGAVAEHVEITDENLPDGMRIDMDSIAVNDDTATIEKGENRFVVRVPEIDDQKKVIVTYSARIKPKALMTGELINTAVARMRSRSAEDDVKASSRIEIRNRITTEVENGTITESVEDIPVGERRTIGYAPHEGYYIKGISIDGEEIDIEGCEDSYSFENITESHHIKVVFAKVPDLAIIKSADRNVHTAGDDILYTLIVENVAKRSSAERVLITDQNMANGTIKPGTVSCDRVHIVNEVEGGFELILEEPLQYGEKTVVTYVVETEKGGDAAVVNTAYAIADGMIDPVGVEHRVSLQQPVTTGDHFNPLIFIMVIFITMAMIIVWAVSGRRKKYEK